VKSYWQRSAAQEVISASAADSIQRTHNTQRPRHRLAFAGLRNLVAQVDSRRLYCKLGVSTKTVASEFRWANQQTRPRSNLPGTFELVFRTDPSIYDGASQQRLVAGIAEPLTKVTWDNVAIVSPNSQQIAAGNTQPWRRQRPRTLTSARRYHDAAGHVRGRSGSFRATDRRGRSISVTVVVWPAAQR
jgi:hypothetical protein